ncbi:MAG TPA: glycine--tRNA ligase subunit beta, partial [Coriobacteriia bacterium]|nr:glycine--tRNA ligase subunit beta [Coriobacteriia bacterium]
CRRGQRLGGWRVGEGWFGVNHELVFEIGTEEIPSAPLNNAIEQLAVAADVALREARLAPEDVRVYGSPRRLVLRVTGLAHRQEDVTLRVRGPAVAVAFDSAGRPTRAAEGFARSKGVDVSALVSGEDADGAYTFAVTEHRGRPASDVLPELLAKLVTGIEWPKSMRWGSGEERFARPVRWLLALLDSAVVPVRFGALVAGRTTHGHRFLGPGPIDVPTAAEYATACERGLVLYDQRRRASVVREGIEAQAVSAGARALAPANVFDEVVNLVEWPTVATGRFDAEFLEVPREVLVSAMQRHQRYFPLEGQDGELLPAFIVVHNGDPARTEAIVAGHERVLRARLADAAFFYREDLTRPLEAYVARLSDIIFHERLGTLAQKVARVEQLTALLAARSGAGPDASAEAARAAHLCKADLTTQVVVEFPTLQGVMGRHYALVAGEAEAVADAIPEHYLPRFAGDAIPASLPGRLVSLADKLDTICGIFAADMAPTGSADPYAVRRSAIGVLTIMLAGPRVPLTDAVSAGLEGYAGCVEFDRDATHAAIVEFFSGRLEVMLRDRGHAYDTVDAVLGVAADDPADAHARCEALTGARGRGSVMDDLSVAFTRAKNLSAPELGAEFDRSLMGAAELTLADALADAAERASAAFAANDYDKVLEVLAALRGPIDGFFDSVLVMDSSDVLRENRLRLLNRFVALFSRFADFSRLTA